MKSFWKILIVLVLLFKIMIIAAAIWLKTDHAKTFLAQTVVDGFKNEFGFRFAKFKVDFVFSCYPLAVES